jgi:hypothetical protein
MIDRNRVIYLLAFIAFTYFALNFFNSSYQGKIISENGINKTVSIIDIPDCGRSSNSMDVEYNNKKYNINIGKNDCIEGKYKIGDRVNVLYSSIYDKVQLPSERSSLLYWMSILFFLIPVYCLFQIIRPFKK